MGESIDAALRVWHELENAFELRARNPVSRASTVSVRLNLRRFWPMDAALFEVLLHEEEGSTLDFKRDQYRFVNGMAAGVSSNCDERAYGDVRRFTSEKKFSTSVTLLALCGGRDPDGPMSGKEPAVWCYLKPGAHAGIGELRVGPELWRLGPKGAVDHSEVDGHHAVDPLTL